VYFVLPGRRRLALANLGVASPAMAEDERRRVCRGSFQHLGLMLVELCKAMTVPPEQTMAGITVVGLEHLKDAIAKHGRALVLTAHLGNWELRRWVTSSRAYRPPSSYGLSTPTGST
jgi:Kdo2-lipid IVA lauroyltransferase/acyltransferase